MKIKTPAFAQMREVNGALQIYVGGEWVELDVSIEQKILGKVMDYMFIKFYMDGIDHRLNELELLNLLKKYPPFVNRLKACGIIDS